MDAMFIIPALISPSVPERLIPGLTKMIERNTLLTYSSQIRSAAIRRYANWFKTATSEGELIARGDELHEEIKASSNHKVDSQKGVKGFTKLASDMGVEMDPFGSGVAVDQDPRAGQPHKVGETEVEVPKGISFFSAVSLEPTLLEIPLEQKKNIFGTGAKSARLLRIGIKCIPYNVEGITDIKRLLKNSKNLSMTTSYVKRRWKSLSKRNILNPTKRRIYRGEESSGNTVTDILMGPTSEDLSNPRILSKLMTPRQSSRWASVIIFTTIDFRGQEMREIMLQYRDIIKAGWGDMVIVDENREGVYFCTTKTMACSLMPYTYLRQILKMDNVIDYRETSSLTRPFRLVPIRAAVRETREDYVVEDELNEGMIKNFKTAWQGEKEVKAIIKSCTSKFSGDKAKISRCSVSEYKKRLNYYKKKYESETDLKEKAQLKEKVGLWKYNVDQGTKRLDYLTMKRRADLVDKKGAARSGRNRGIGGVVGTATRPDRYK